MSFWDVIDLTGSGRTLLPRAIAAPASGLAQVMKSISPRRLARLNPIRTTIVGYSHIAGIESPYTFFAPNVPESLKVVFEIHLADGRVIYDIPHVKSTTEALRLSALIDQAAAHSGLWREIVLQMLAASAADINPEATRVRVVVEALKFPPPAEYLNGTQPLYQFVSSDDFRFNGAREPNGGE